MGRKGEETTFTSLQYQQFRDADFGKQGGHKTLTKTTLQERRRTAKK